MTTDSLSENRYELKTCGTASIYIEGGMYTEKDIKAYLEYFKIMNKRAKELAQDIVDRANRG